MGWYILLGCVRQILLIVRPSVNGKSLPAGQGDTAASSA